LQPSPQINSPLQPNAFPERPLVKTATKQADVNNDKKRKRQVESDEFTKVQKMNNKLPTSQFQIQQPTNQFVASIPAHQKMNNELKDDAFEEFMNNLFENLILPEPI